MGLVAPRHVGSSRTRARTCVPCIGRWILNHCATREVPGTDSWIQGQAVGVTPSPGTPGLRRKTVPWQYLIYLTYFGNDGFFSGGESLHLYHPLTSDCDTSTYLWDLPWRSSMCKWHRTCLLSYAYGVTELLRLGYHHSFPILYVPLMLELPETWRPPNLHDWALLFLAFYSPPGPGVRLHPSGLFWWVHNTQVEPHPIFL